MWLAGGGIKPGITYGATDELGYHAVDNVVHVHDLHATMLHLLGIDHERLTYRYQGRDFRLTDVAGKVVSDILVSTPRNHRCRATMACYRRPCEATLLGVSRDETRKLGILKGSFILPHYTCSQSAWLEWISDQERRGSVTEFAASCAAIDRRHRGFTASAPGRRRHKRRSSHARSLTRSKSKRFTSPSSAFP